MNDRKTSLRELIANSLLLLEDSFEHLPARSQKVFPDIVRSSDGSCAVCLEMGFITLLCFLDASNTVFGLAAWRDAFHTGVARLGCDSLAKRFYHGESDTCWQLFQKRLTAFNESSDKIGFPSSNWLTIYVRGSAEKLNAFLDDEEDVPAWWRLGLYYAKARGQFIGPFVDFLLQHDVTLDVEDKRMLAELE